MDATAIFQLLSFVLAPAQPHRILKINNFWRLRRFYLLLLRFYLLGLNFVPIICTVLFLARDSLGSLDAYLFGRTAEAGEFLRNDGVLQFDDCLGLIHRLLKLIHFLRRLLPQGRRALPLLE